MRERPEQILKFVCWGLAALVLFQVIRVAMTANPLAHVVIPALPSLAQKTSIPSRGTNSSAAVISTNKTGRNLKTAAKPGKTNAIQITTNVAARTGNVSMETHSNSRPLLADAGTNGVAHRAPALPDAQHLRSGPQPASRLVVAPGLMTSRGKAPLTPAIQARVVRITDSEILGPVIRPLPMALLGIAGNVAFLRAPDGQTGLVKKGGKLGGIKLLRIGTNRVLIEQAGQKRELTIFAGLGGHSLLHKSPESSHETKTH